MVDEKLCKDCPELSKGCGSPKDSEKMKRCVKHVIDQGKPEDSAHAICNASINKSSVPTVINTYKQGASPVDLNAHLLAVNATSDCPYLEKLSKEMESLDMFGINDFTVVSKSGVYNMNISKKDINQLSGVLRDSQGTIVQEFDNQTPEIIASIMRAKIGEMVMDKLEPVVEAPALIPSVDLNNDSDVKDLIIHSKNNVIESQQNELENITNALEQEMAIKKPSTKIEIEDGKVTITLLKSKENSMDFAEETLDMLIKAFPKKKEEPKPEEQEAAPEAPQSNGLTDSQPAEEAAPQDAAAPEAPAAPAEEPEKTPEELEAAEQSEVASEEATEEAGDKAGEEQIGDKEAEEGIEGQEDVLKEINTQNPEASADAGILPEDSMNPEANLNPEANHQYIKFSEHANGKQYWYKDPTTGQIFEKDNAPEGHPDYNHGEAMQDLTQKVAELEQKINMLASGQEVPVEASPEISADSKNLAPEAMENSPEIAPEMPQLNANQPENLPEAPEAPEAPIAPKAPAPKAPASKPAPKEAAPKEKAPAEAKEEMSKDAEPKKEDKKPFPPKKKDSDEKIKKSLQEKYPQLSEEKIVEIIEKAKKLKKADAPIISPEVDKIVSDPRDEFENLQNKKAKKLKKSRLSRMWTVFGIEMPETLEKAEDTKKANEGIQKLQKCIMKQGKTEEETNRIVNRAVVEKYDLESFNGYKGGSNYNVDTEVKNAVEMQNLRKSDADKRFEVKEYLESNEKLVVEGSSDIAERVSKIVNPEAPKWEGFKEFKEEIKKSTPTEFEKTRNATVDARWNMKEFKGNIDAKDMIKTNPSTMQDRITKSETERHANADFSKRYKSFEESKTKLEKSSKTETEILNEKIEKANWTPKK